MSMSLEGMNTGRSSTTSVTVGDAGQVAAPAGEMAEVGGRPLAAVVGGPGVVVSEADAKDEAGLPLLVDAKVLSEMIDSAYRTMRRIAENMGVSKEEAERKAERQKQREKETALADELERLQTELAEKKISAEAAYSRLQGLLKQDERLLSEAREYGGLSLRV